jgi:hypothetical protein
LTRVPAFDLMIAEKDKRNRPKTLALPKEQASVIITRPFFT